MQRSQKIKIETVQRIRHDNKKKKKTVEGIDNKRTINNKRTIDARNHGVGDSNLVASIGGDDSEVVGELVAEPVVGEERNIEASQR